MKLSKPTMELLIETARGDGASCVKAYKPAQELVALGLCEWHRDNQFGGTLRATDAGRAALEGRTNDVSAE